MNRTEIINAIIDRFQFSSYLEIGTEAGINLSGVRCKLKHGVDPDPKSVADFHMTSDEFLNTCTWKYDIVFIDGLHHAEQFVKDVLNSMRVLNDGGVIVCHDCNPTTEIMQRVPRETDVWTGDVWKGWTALRQVGMEGFVVNTDWGVGVISSPRLFIPGMEIIERGVIVPDYKYSDLEKNRVKWLNLQTEEYFTKWLSKAKKIRVYGNNRRNSRFSQGGFRR